MSCDPKICRKTLRRSPRPYGWLICATFLLALGLPSPAVAQGFGSSKKKITLHRKLPPRAHLNGDAIQVTVTGRGIQADVATELRNMLEAELLKDDHRLRAEDKHPDSIISCTITEYVPAMGKTTTRNTLPVGSKKQSTETVTRYSGLLKLAYVAKDAHSGRTLDSDNIVAKYDDEWNQYGSTNKSITDNIAGQWNKLKHGKLTADKPPTDTDVRNMLLDDAVSQIASRLVNTDETVEVLLARGKLDDPNKLADSGLWTRNLEALETMTPFPSKEDDAYRLYNIGVSYEAMAYSSEDPKAAQKYLQEAAINYGKAIDDKPGERYFMQPQNRIDTAIAHYKTLRDQPKTVAAADSDTSKSAGPAGNTNTPAVSDTAATHSPARPVRTTGANSAGTATAANGGPPAGAKTLTSTPRKPSGPPLTNDQIVQMVKAGVDEDNVIETIRSAATVKFDLSVDGQVKLAQAGVKGKVLTAMKNKARTSSVP
jgi:hypothetical protein